MMSVSNHTSQSFDEETDVLVVGTGAGGLAAATVAAARGARVVVLEKAAGLGGTTRKSAAGIWIPNNRFMREDGRVDRPEDTIRFLARVARPALFDPDAERFGLPEWEYEITRTFVETASAAQEELERLGAMYLARNQFDMPDYQAQRPENLAPRGRGLYEAKTKGGPTGGQGLIDGLVEGATAHGAQIRVSHEVTDVIVDGERVVGAVVASPAGIRRMRTLGGVIFASGGFTHNAHYRLQYLNGPFVGGCAVETNTGDFVRIATALGAELANMSEAWTVQINTERMRREPDTFMSSFYLLGDGMIEVNRAGHRVVNEKAPYNELGRVMSNWDPIELRYPNMPLIAIWDQETADRWGIDRFGNPVPAPGVDAYWVVSGDSLEELGAAIEGKLVELGPDAGNARLDPDFTTNLAASIDRFAGFADRGSDEDFRRGESPFERYISARFGEGDGPNPTMRRLDLGRRLYATVLSLGTLDTKGGPRTTTQRQVLRGDGSIIEGLWAVGNCAASSFGQGYPGGGATLGPILTEGYLAGLDVVRSFQLAG